MNAREFGTPLKMTLRPVATQMDVERFAESGLCSATTASTLTSSYMDKTEDVLPISADSATAKGKCQRA
jgi:hypothetical protein